ILGIFDALAALVEMLKAAVSALGIGDWESARDLWRDITYSVLKPMVDMWRNMLTIILAAKTAVDLMVYGVLKLAGALSSITKLGDAKAWSKSADDFYNTVLKRDREAIGKLFSAGRTKNPLGKPTSSGLGAISDIGRVARPPEFSGLAEFWKKMQSQIL